MNSATNVEEAVPDSGPTQVSNPLFIRLTLRGSNHNSDCYIAPDCIVAFIGSGKTKGSTLYVNGMEDIIAVDEDTGTINTLINGVVDAVSDNA